MKTPIAALLAITLATGCATTRIPEVQYDEMGIPIARYDMAQDNEWTPGQALLALVLLLGTVGLLAYAASEVGGDGNRLGDPDVVVKDRYNTTRIYYKDAK
jgi:hypothetical protein